MEIFFGVYVLIGLFLLASPVIAFVAIVQWATKKRGAIAPGYQQGYQRGVRDSFGLVRGVEGVVTKERLDMLESSLVGSPQPYVPATPQAPSEQRAQSIHIPGLELPGEAPAVADTQPEQAPSMVTQVDEPDITQLAIEAAPVATAPKANNLSGINLLLSLSSLLFVAAGIAFIASPFSDSGKLFVLVAIVALFYGGGLVLYKTIQRVRPAAVSFVGTGLALIPFLGIAFVRYADVSVMGAWLLVSVIGLVAYVAAAFVLQSSVVSYLSVAFLLSLTSSAVANAELPVAWHFAAFITLSLLASLLAHYKPDWVPRLFLQPVVQTGNVVTPLAATASLFWIGTMQVREYEVIFCLTTLHYVVAWLQTRQNAYEQIARAVAHAALLVFAWDFAGGFTNLFGVWFLAAAVLQHLYSLLRWGGAVRTQTESAWMAAMLALQAVAMVWWPDAWMWVFATVVVLIMSICSIVITKRSLFGVASLYSLATLPVLTGLVAAVPRWSFGAVALGYVVMGGAVLAAAYLARAKLDKAAQALLRVGFWLFAVLAFIFAAIESAAAASVGLLAVGVLLVLVASYIFCWPAVMVVVAAATPVVLWRYCVSNAILSDYVLIISAGSAVLMYAATGLMLWLRQTYRGGIALMAGHVYLLIALILGIPLSFQPLSTGHQIIVALALLLGASGLWWLARFDVASPTRRSFHRVFYVVYYLCGLYMSLQLPAWWLALAILAGVALLWEASYTYGSTGLAGIANIATVWMLWVACAWVGGSSQWVPLVSFGVAALMFYVAAWQFGRVGDNQRRQIMLWSVWLASIGGFVAGYVSDGYAVTACVLLIAGAASMVQEGVRTKYAGLTELGAYIATFGFMTMVSKVFPDMPWLVYPHMAALAVAGVAAFRSHNQGRYQIAAVIVTAFVGLDALSQGGGYSLLFLTEQIMLSVAGVATKLRWATWWGVAGAVFAVFYYLRESPFLIFSLLGAGIAAFVIWRLSRKTDS